LGRRSSPYSSPTTFPIVARCRAELLGHDPSAPGVGRSVRARSFLPSPRRAPPATGRDRALFVERLGAGVGSWPSAGALFSFSHSAISLMSGSMSALLFKEPAAPTAAPATCSSCRRSGPFSRAPTTRPCNLPHRDQGACDRGPACSAQPRARASCFPPRRGLFHCRRGRRGRRTSERAAVRRTSLSAFPSQRPSFVAIFSCCIAPASGPLSRVAWIPCSS